MRPAIGLALFAVLAAGALLSCARLEPTRADRCGENDAGTPIDPTLLAFLSSARAAHHSADVREQQGDIAGAVNVLEQLIKGPTPKGNQRPEVNEVLADSQARLADLYSRQGNEERAFAALDTGLALATDPTYFRGHLFEVRGLLEERRADALTKTGNPEGAKSARDRALQSFEESMRIQAEVIQKAAPRPEPAR